MGGSSYSGGYGGPQLPNECEGIFEFAVIINVEADLLISGFKVGQDVKVELVKEKLPKLQVVRLQDSMFIGLVPPSYSMLIKCIELGWKYYGNITRIEGIEINPKIFIRVKGEK